MKRILAITASLSLAFAGTAMAAALTSGSVTTTDGLQIFGGISSSDAASTTTSTMIGKLSKGVKFGVNYSNTGYAADTKHNSGNTAYGTSNDATAIYKSEIGLATALTAPSSPDVSSFNSWTAM
ncbi:hypothetical protein [Geobacter sp. AOG1]|uniref:hypothetical protein n=1 Tax=Geobacter sp. AOG1 TaxID=1566346 RepID=UPI001CC72EB2|nr:hypothetical protein [Geobacter sp. AOG1]GFE58463.1 hypothetical protein AOG1_23430 [Geobacter sp. AOG1]